MTSYVTGAGIVILSMIITSNLGLFAKWIDRKVSARVQWRKGPPWYQPWMDILKLLGKEIMVPETAARTIFMGAPIAAFAAVSIASAILWTVLFKPEASFVGDLIVVLYLLVIPSLATVMGGAESILGQSHTDFPTNRIRLTPISII